MRKSWDLAGEWGLIGWRQNDWELASGFAGTIEGTPDVREVPAVVPGSVRAALVAAGVVPDPFHGRASRESEWIEHRHWTLRRSIPDELVAELAANPEARAVLVADSLDYAGAIRLDDTIISWFRGSIVPVEVDITEALRAGARMLTVALTDVPSDLGAIGRTSKIREWKARYGHGWDWTPRTVQIGIAGPIAVELRAGTLLADTIVTARVDDGEIGSVTVRADVPGDAPLTISVTGPGVEASASVVGPGPHTVDVGHVERWQLLPDGHQTLYQVRVAVDEPDGDTVVRRVGFRTIVWESAPDAPEGAEPWVCVLNGRRVFLGGVNWVPIRGDYADVTYEDYRARLQAYRDMDVRILRVWGGAALESETFYDLCDELGILTWQELPLSSSALDNTPPRDAEYAAETAVVARSYAIRRAHHPSLIMWDLGNELTDEAEQLFDVLPLSPDHPAAATAAAVFAQLDPERRWVVTSPTGPSMWALPGTWGRGIHHDVHGPWDQFSDTVEQWHDYWESDDAVMRSEVGVGGASPMDILEEFGLAQPIATEEQRAALHDLWMHSSPKRMARFEPVAGLTLLEQVEAHQRRQADLLSFAARHTAERFPSCGGFIVWMGHDTFPVAISQSVLDFFGRPKPAALALAEVFRAAAR